MSEEPTEAVKQLYVASHTVHSHVSGIYSLIPGTEVAQVGFESDFSCRNEASWQTINRFGREKGPEKSFGCTAVRMADGMLLLKHISHRLHSPLSSDACSHSPGC